MRIIGGKHRGRILKGFDGVDIRPTSDRAREALFNIFQLKIAGSTFYDGFCGSGAVGIEALSRGAKEVVFTDLAKKSVALTTENLAMIGERATVICSDSLTFLRSTDKKFDFIFLDPPYASEVGVEAIKIVAERKILASGGYLIYENDDEINSAFDGLEYVSSRRYGKNCFNIYTTK